MSYRPAGRPITLGPVDVDLSLSTELCSHCYPPVPHDLNEPYPNPPSSHYSPENVSMQAAGRCASSLSRGTPQGNQPVSLGYPFQMFGLRLRRLTLPRATQLSGNDILYDFQYDDSVDKVLSLLSVFPHPEQMDLTPHSAVVP